MIRSAFVLMALAFVLVPTVLVAQNNEDIAGAAAGAGGCLACGGFLLFIGIAIAALHIALLVWIYRDAKNRGTENAVVWMLVVLFFPLIGAIIYLLARTKGNLVACPRCEGKRLEVSAKCPHCGNA